MSTFLIFVSVFFLVGICEPKTLQSLKSRIINGNPAADGQFPWQVALDVTSGSSKTWCGGALISSRWVLTAGHCVQTATHISVRLGSVKLQEEDPNRVIIDTIQWILHEGYSSRLDNDVAVIFLPRVVEFNDYIQPIELASSPTSSGTTVTVSGWGLTSDSETKPSPFLNYVSLSTIPDKTCSDVFGSLPRGAFCAKQQGSVPQGTCEGDSGGPLVVGKTHVGVVSFGHSDGCESENPVAFARTDFYRDWIRDQTGI